MSPRTTAAAPIATASSRPAASHTRTIGSRPRRCAHASSSRVVSAPARSSGRMTYRGLGLGVRARARARGLGQGLELGLRLGLGLGLGLGLEEREEYGGCAVALRPGELEGVDEAGARDYRRRAREVTWSGLGLGLGLGLG